ncbi:8310_t:CDS:2, partial [Racocetra persica]
SNSNTFSRDNSPSADDSETKSNQEIVQRLNNLKNLVKNLQKLADIAISKIKRIDWNQIQKAAGLKPEAIQVNPHHEIKCDMFQ